MVLLGFVQLISIGKIIGLVGVLNQSMIVKDGNNILVVIFGLEIIWIKGSIIQEIL